MKHYFITSLLLFTSLQLFSQKSGYVFNDVKRLETTPVKNQFKSSTCWSYCVTSFMESEILRTLNIETDLSEMWAVRHAYEMKADKYVRMHGKINFGGGGAMNDVTDVWREYGILPENYYSGLEIGEEKHMHGEMDNLLKEYVEAITENSNRKLSPVWMKGYKNILDTYLGVKPKEFEYKNESYTPESYLDELNLNMDDYVIISSFTHHPFYEPFIVEVPDNWSWGEAYNVKLDELIQILDYSIDNGYTVAWASDVSEKGFSFKNGIAIVPDEMALNDEGTDKERWEQLSDKEKKDKLYSFEKPVEELKITQSIRQKAFDNFQTTDDHGMHIIGKAKDQNNESYYIVKNSWGTDNPYDGYFYASDNYVRYKTISIMLHKDAIPVIMQKKLNL